jgi:L-amino acid N-acyltransferase YncA
LIVIVAITAPTLMVNAEEQTTTVNLIDAHSVWQYEDSDTNLFGDIASDFRAKDFEDAAWKSGSAPLGYGASETDNGMFGKISEGGTLVSSRGAGNAILTYYFRHSFAVQDIADIQALSAQITVDDGYVMYLNGHEVSRANMGTGEVSHDSDAEAVLEATEPQAKITADLTAYRQYLVVGENVIAVDVHNRDKNSSDIYFGMTLNATLSVTEENPADAEKTPKQVNVHMGADPSTEANFTYTTVASDATRAVLTNTETGERVTLDGESSVGGGSKYYHKIPATGLAPNTTYTYTVGIAPNTYSGEFKTALARGSKESFSFIYLADTQVSNATNGKALGATLAEVANMDPDFVYLAGDITDTATSEAQWEQLFNNSGSFPDGGQDMFGNYLISAIQGNHDNNTFNRHINAPAQAWSGTQGNIVYAYDYGPLTFIMLNLETARSDATSRALQKEYLQSAVADAKARGQWTAVGFHKSLYTGASHIVDSDVIDARKYWGPTFAELDVDFVLQGHDHVYSRGFVTEEGTNAGLDAQKGATVQDPANAPLWMVGGHAGGLKWYSRVNYAVGSGDPLATGYSFLDVDSANPAHNADGVSSDVKQEQVIVEMDVSDTSVTINSYMFKYNTTTDTITTQKYLYDTLTVERAVASAGISGTELAVIETDEEITYTVAYNNLSGADAFDTVIEYDADVLEFASAASLLENTLISQVDDSESGKVRMIIGLGSGVTAETQDVATFTFRAKKPVTADSTTVRLARADTVATSGSGEGKTAVDVPAVIKAGEALTSFYSYKKASDVNGDGKVTLADLSLALSRYQSVSPADKKYDVNLDGIVDAKDFIIISGYIAA